MIAFADSNCWFLILSDFIKEQAAQERQITSQTFQEYIIQYFQNMLKAPIDEPIIVSKDSIQEMLIKVRLNFLSPHLVKTKRHDQRVRK